MIELFKLDEAIHPTINSILDYIWNAQEDMSPTEFALAMQWIPARADQKRATLMPVNQTIHGHLGFAEETEDWEWE